MSRARDFADLAGSADAGGLTGRNLIINGAMQVAQRSTSETGLGGSVGYFTVDRFHFAVGSTAGRLTMSQASVTDLPGFANAMKLDCTTADTSIAAGEFLIIQHKFEGQDLQVLKKGTSSAQPVTVSFYMKTNKAFTFMCELDDTDNNRVNTQQFTTSTSWTRHEITFAGDTSGTLDDDNARSMQLGFWLHAGSTYTGGTYSANTWQSRASSDNMRAVGIGSFFDSTDNEIQITGVQLEVGEKATPFEHRSFGDELARCQRYFFQVREGSGEFTQFAHGRFYSSSAGNALVRFPQPMRANPDLTALGATGDYDFSPTNLPQSGQVTTTANTAGSTSDVIAMAVGNNFSSVTSGAMYILGGNAGTGGNAGLQFEAEL